MTFAWNEPDEHDEDERDGAVRSRLLNPQTKLSLTDFAEHWFETNLVWCVKGCSHAAPDPGLLGRLRGAFGTELLASASPQSQAGKPCPWVPPCAFEVLFRKQGRLEPGLDIPGCWVIEVDPVGKDLVVTLRLFGFAADFAPSAADAMTKALVHSLDYQGKTGMFFPKPEITNRSITTVQGLPDAFESTDEIIIEFLSPVLLSSVDVSLHARSLVTTLVARLAGLARWHDLEIETDRRNLRAMTERLTFRWLETHRLHWHRGSQRQGKIIPMSGVMGTLLISAEDTDDLADARQILRFGQRSHIGADAAYGCGRFVFVENAFEL